MRPCQRYVNVPLPSGSEIVFAITIFGSHLYWERGGDMLQRTIIGQLEVNDSEKKISTVSDKNLTYIHHHEQ